jgi:hypothetical protein
MINQKILESLYAESPQTIADLKFSTGCEKSSEVSFAAIDLMMGGLIYWDAVCNEWRYQEDAWL